ncbi:hypothetical protein D5041_04215 [Verminephrobacter aporrectodeae subsp. tuberculatae]|uniref:hypothetical protein n=1 Tax=Verminephrobacter aporrectodeae TaxID=1110389 RepID=UPI0022391029|nr:hypothetical protein [Verminephrobacter aporrectodeae]MCW5222831.1 hypothetical protein [Verminephrobacter aporrectodeae subsp. tuberculatae]MCW5288295.1 hypothetical protein [Verminephrobacter aporrectodeae subsp. tuberculatae]
MKFTQKIHVVGMKSSKGTLENGMAYDSTKVYALVDLDASKGTAKGMASSEFTLGTSEEFSKYKNLSFPFEADAEMEIVTNGKTQKTVMHSCVPATRVPAKQV